MSVDLAVLQLFWLKYGNLCATNNRTDAAIFNGCADSLRIMCLVFCVCFLLQVQAYLLTAKAIVTNQRNVIAMVAYWNDHETVLRRKQHNEQNKQRTNLFVIWIDSCSKLKIPNPKAHAYNAPNYALNARNSFGYFKWWQVRFSSKLNGIRS